MTSGHAGGSPEHLAGDQAGGVARRDLARNRSRPREKALRTCLVAERIGEELGLGERARSDTCHAALIHPVECTAFTYEGARVFGTSELKGIPAYARADPARLSEGIRAMREELRGEPVGRRVRGTIKSLTAGNKFLDYAVRADCEAGTQFTKRIGLADSVASIVVQVYERRMAKVYRPGSAARRSRSARASSSEALSRCRGFPGLGGPRQLAQPVAEVTQGRQEDDGGDDREPEGEEAVGEYAQ